ALFPLIDEVFATRPTAEWCELLDANGIRCAPVRDHSAVVEDPNVWANGYLTTVDGTTIVAPPVRFSETPADPARGALELGQHIEEILLELGFSWDDIAALSHENVT